MAEFTRKTWPRYVFIVLVLCLIGSFVFYHLRTSSSTDKSTTTTTTSGPTTITTHAEQQSPQTQASIDGSSSTPEGSSQSSSQSASSASSQSDGPPPSSPTTTTTTTTGADQQNGSSPAVDSIRADLHKDDRPGETIKPISNEIATDVQPMDASASSPLPDTNQLKPKETLTDQQQQQQQLSESPQQPQKPSLMDLLNSGNNSQQMSLPATNNDGIIPDLGQAELDKWQEFKIQYRRQYGSLEEDQRRQAIFLANWRYIRSFNELGSSLFRLDINQFADYTRDEINQIFIGPQMNWNETLSAQQMGSPPPKILLDESSAVVDWRNLTGAPVDQGTCRESSVFAAVASLESTLNSMISSTTTTTTTGGQQQLIKLSEQQLLDCLTFQAPAPPQSGWPAVCQGRLSMVHVFDFLQNNTIRLAQIPEYSEFKRLQAAHVAPPNTCQLPPSVPEKPRLHSYVQVHRDNLQEAVQNSGPLVVALDASQSTFHFYKSGLYHELTCSTDTYNLHALLVAHSPAGAAAAAAAAADATSGQPQDASYTIRASFGPQWGEAGFMRLLKDDNRNKCLPQNLAIYPNIALT